jgi:hypothetical protein
MKKYLLIFAVAALVTGCASNLTTKDSSDPGAREEAIKPFSRAWLIRYNPFVAALARPVRLYIFVYVDGSRIIVDQEPVHVLYDEGVTEPIMITWLIGGTTGYSFPDKDSIYLSSVESGPAYTSFKCSGQGQAPYTILKCLLKRSAGGKSKYSYTIKLTDPNDPKNKPIQSDPYIAND